MNHRHDLCTKENCDLLGLANVAAACLPSDSCAITEDNGLILGVVLAHEIGHMYVYFTTPFYFTK